MIADGSQRYSRAICSMDPRNHLITIGEETLTLTEWSERFGIAPALAATRIHKLGWSAARAVSEPPEERSKPRLAVVVVRLGDEEMTVSQWCKRLGLPKKTITARLRSGWCPVEALTTPIRRLRPYVSTEPKRVA